MEKEELKKIYWVLVDFYRKYNLKKEIGFTNELDFANTLVDKIEERLSAYPEENKEQSPTNRE